MLYFHFCRNVTSRTLPYKKGKVMERLIGLGNASGQDEEAQMDQGPAEPRALVLLSLC